MLALYVTGGESESRRPLIRDRSQMEPRGWRKGDESQCVSENERRFRVGDCQPQPEARARSARGSAATRCLFNVKSRPSICELPKLEGPPCQLGSSGSTCVARAHSVQLARLAAAARERSFVHYLTRRHGFRSRVASRMAAAVNECHWGAAARELIVARRSSLVYALER